MPQTVFTWRHTHQLVERSVERLAVGETDHVAHLLHTEILVTLVHKNGHGLVNTILVDERSVVHVKTDIHHSRDITRVRTEILSQFLGRIILVALLLLHDDDVHDLLLHLIHQAGAYQTAIGSLLFLFFCNVVLTHNT